MRSKLPYIALVFFCLSGSAKSQLPEISINQYIETTGEVIIPIYVSNVTNAASVTFSVHYNGDVLEYTGVQNHYFPNIIINNNPVRDAENTFTINAAWFAGGGQGQTIDGVFFEMIFTFSGGSSDFSILNEEFADNSYSIIPINVSSGSIAYQEPIEVALGELFDTPPGLIDIPVFVDFSVVEAGVGAFDFLIEYDHNVLSDPGITDEIFVGIVLTEPEPGQIRLQWENPEPYGSQLDGQLLNLSFDFAGGGMSVLAFIHDSGSISNQDGINLPVTFTDGFIDGAKFDVVFRVNDGLNGQVTNASIVLGDMENQPGDYTFTDVKAGIYSYSVTAPGFSETTGTLELDQNLNISVQIDDIENPEIACPADILNIPADEGVNYAIIANIGEPIVSDNHTPVDDLLVTNNAPENNLYPVGETTVTWTVTDAAGNTANCSQTILVVDDETLPPTFESLHDITVHHGENVCFDATQTIITAGGNTYFIVEGGGSVSLIAGESIRMLPGTSVENGGYLHARITLEGEYCDTPVTKSLEEPVEEPLAEQLVPAMPDKDVLFKVYPNPTTGEFTLELMDALAYKQVTVEVYGLRGERLFSENIPPMQQHIFTLEKQLPGIYVVRVTAGERTDNVRIIKR